MSTPPRLFLIDGFSNVFRAFYAIRELSTAKGEPTNAVYGFVQMLRKLLRDENPELVGVAWDVSDVTVRSERYAEYKANRAPMPEALRPQLPWIRRALAAFRIPVLELEGYEADDVLGTLARQAAGRGYEVVLVSADKDLMQLVGPGVSVFHTGRNRLYDEAAVREEWGVPPPRVADVLALQGDSVDNVPGVPGIGEKGARQLIAEHGSLEALLERAGEVSRKAYREGLEKHREQALLSKELVTIHTELPLDLDVEALRHDPPDPAALRALYTELEFFSLLEELGAAAAAPGEGSPPAREVRDARELAAALAELSEEVAVALLGGETPLALAVGGPGKEPVLADFRHAGLRDAAVAALAELAADPGRLLVGHDLKEVLRLLPAPVRPAARLWDAMLVSYLLRPSVHGHGLAELAAERLGRQPLAPRDAGWDRGAEPALGDERLARFAGEAVDLPLRLLAPFGAELGSGALARVYWEIEAPLLPVLLAMESAGIALDGELLRSMSREMEGELVSLEREVHELAGEPFNLNSPQQLGRILFEKLGYPAGRRTQKTKSWSTDADTLTALATRGYPLPERLLRYRELAKLKSTYVDALPALAGPDGRVHTRFQQAVAATGRLSSINPNLQNIPVRTELGQRIRRAFRAAPGHLLVAADYSQIELRVLAHIAEEPALIDAFRRGEDIHRTTAASVFGVAADLVTADQRRAAKAINFGLIYGMGAFGLAQTLGVDTKEAERFIAAYFARFARVQEYMRETLGMAERDGRVETLAGRVRWLPEIHAKSWNLRENARRMAINARIQGTAADILKRAMIAVDRRLAAELPAARLLLTVHDELVLEAPEEAAGAAAELVRTEMEAAESLAVPLVAEAGWGPNWMAAKS
ncbi:MAG: DNA polymerase I [Thermoanaerobaculia bacterium]|nr:DNA polymerase I [Thermoanaerobaculia bacterium]